MCDLMPAHHFQQTLIYHITHVENLARILESEAVLAKNQIRSIRITSIANEEIQTRRACKIVQLPPHGCLHDYVPFYFAPRSPMLFCNYRGTIANAKPQEEIIHLVTTAQVIEESGLPFVFYDRHAVVGYAQAYNDLGDLGRIDWRIFFEHPLLGHYAKYWQDRQDAANPHWMSRKEVRQAEFLVHQKVPFGCIQSIGVKTQETYERTLEILNLHSCEREVNIVPEWYF